MLIRTVATLSMLGIALAAADDAQGQSRPDQRLAAATYLTCEFTTMAVGNWGAAGAVAETKAAKLSLGFRDVNADEGSARVIGPFGPADIIVRLTSGALHFVQSFSDGPMYTTTIFPSEARAGKLKAVHTRHEYTQVSLPGYTSRPEQYYGECEIVN
jgi:hypothetical protein